MVIEAGKVYRTRKGDIVTITDKPIWSERFPFQGDNEGTYLALGILHDLDLVEEVTRFRTQQEVWGYLAGGGYLTYEDKLLGFHEGRLSLFNRYGEFLNLDLSWGFDFPERWTIGFVQTKPVPKWYYNIPEQGILCWLDDYYKDKQLITGLKVVIAYEPEKDKPFVTFRSEAAGTVSYRYATPATLDVLANFIYECE